MSAEAVETKKPKGKKRSAATGRGNVRELVKSYAKEDEDVGISKDGISTLVAIINAEVEALTTTGVDVMERMGSKTFSTHVAAAAVKMRYSDQDICTNVFDTANHATTRYINSHSA